jgi:hypothetical protein
VTFQVFDFFKLIPPKHLRPATKVTHDNIVRLQSKMFSFVGQIFDSSVELNGTFPQMPQCRLWDSVKTGVAHGIRIANDLDKPAIQQDFYGRRHDGHFPGKPG